MALESFAIEFTKLVQILEQVRIDKDIDVHVFVQGNSALAEAKGESDALGPNTATETAAFTTTTAVQGVGSSSSSIAESLAAATRDAKVDWTGLM
jgi:hypothetical protein